MNLELTAVIIAVVELIKKLPNVGSNVTGWVTPVLATALGVGFAFVNNGDLVQGALAGLAAVGIHTVGRTVSGK